ncbi:FAD-dependent oxidoreductase [Sphingomonas oryzagri]|uniref:FAD-dependent oxidoreductase n=1 Tax=Sphingomonas oryzagri TaxID=3042314 RepID=A0ABT6MY12_9SPHN|nr:FAD-dependent oxidoreductase [Sphingomonas oryzagri]MDH7637697.1 FAD-dependent oxidoreductase [Sphingomonas oryzagri]
MTDRRPVSRRDVLGGIAVAGALTARSAQARPAKGQDVVVVGAGVFGAWTALVLQHRGAKVLLLDAWGAAHSRASSGGETRLIRTEYGGDPLYTRWAWDSLAEWKALSARHESPLFHETGALYIYPKNDAKIDRSIALQRSMGIPVEKMAPDDLARRWPQMSFAGVGVGLLQPTMGALMARRAVQTLVADFVKAGGTFRQLSVEPPQAGGSKLTTIVATSRERLNADRFVFACGPWLAKLFPNVIGARIVPIRKDVFFFSPEAGDGRFAPPHMPAWVDAGDPDLHYGFPDIEARGFKIALDGPGEAVDPDTDDRRVGDRALADACAYLRRRFPALAERPLAEQRVCQYENTDDRNFLIDRHPAWADTWVVGGGSGHGFKHGLAVARYVADLMAGTGKIETRFALASHKAWQAASGRATGRA